MHAHIYAVQTSTWLSSDGLCFLFFMTWFLTESETFHLVKPDSDLHGFACLQPLLSTEAISMCLRV